MTDVTSELNLPADPPAHEQTTTPAVAALAQSAWDNADVSALLPVATGVVGNIQGELSKYAAVLLPFFVIVLGGSQTVLKDPTNWPATIPYLIVVLGAAGTFLAKLITNSKWAGRTKTLIAVATALLAGLLPFVIPGGWSGDANYQVVGIALLNILATQLGVTIRTGGEQVIDAGTADGDTVPSITSLTKDVPAHLA